MAATMSKVKAAWQRIEAWLRENDTSGQLCLPPGAGPGEIDRAEESLGMKLPAEVRESYLLHNGSNRVWVFEQGYLLPLTAEGARRRVDRANSVVGVWEGMAPLAEEMREEASEPDGPIKARWWHTRWVPFTDNQCGDCLCLDLDPPKGGRKGQVIDWWHECGPTCVLAGSFGEFLARHADELETGIYRLSNAGAVVRAERN